MGLKSHFDFVVTDRDYFPLFSVEYDGRQHKVDSKQVQRDLVKNGICENRTTRYYGSIRGI
jgi:uncharacterized protein DUF2726